MVGEINLTDEQEEMLKRAAERKRWNLTEMCPYSKLPIAQSLCELGLIEGRWYPRLGIEGGVWISVIKAGKKYLESIKEKSNG